MSNIHNDPRTTTTPEQDATVRGWPQDAGQVLDDLDTDTIVATPAPPTMDLALQEFAGRETALASLRDRYADAAKLPATTKDGYENRRRAVGELRKFWVAVEQRRKELKADSIAFGRQVDAVAKQLDAAAHAIAEPLQIAMAAVDEAKEREKREKAEAERKAIEDAERARLAEQAARLKAERDAEQARLSEQAERLAAERAKLDRERSAIEAEQAKHRAWQAEEQSKRDADRQAEQYRMANERAALDRQRQELMAEQERQAKAERDRLAQQRAELEAREQAERDRVAAAEREAARVASEQAEAARLAALAPDRVKLAAFAAAIRQLPEPMLANPEAVRELSRARHMIDRVADLLERWTGE